MYRSTSSFQNSTRNHSLRFISFTDSGTEREQGDINLIHSRITMPLQNPKGSSLETESKKTQHQQKCNSVSMEFKDPLSFENTNVGEDSNSSKSEASTVAPCRESAAVVSNTRGAEGTSTAAPSESHGTLDDNGGGSSGRERLKRHRVEVAGRVWIPDMWGQENLLKDWIDCTAFDATLVNSSIMSARAALVEEGRRANSTRLRIENSC